LFEKALKRHLSSIDLYLSAK